MARTHGKDVNYSFNAIAIEDELDEVRMRFDVPEADITAFADAWQNFLAGKPNVSAELRGTLDMAASQGIKTLFAAMGSGPVTTVFDLTGSGPDTGKPEYTCTASGLTGSLVDSLRISLPVNDAGRYEARIINSGDTTRAVA